MFTILNSILIQSLILFLPLTAPLAGLPDLDAWAGIVAHFLKPGGIFYIADFHPTLWMMDDNFEHIKYDYFNTAIITEEISGTYSDRNSSYKIC